MANFQYAIFDLDGTLLDSMKYWRFCTVDYLRETLGLEISGERKAELVKMNIPSAAEYLAKEMNLHLDAKEMLRQIRKNLLRHYSVNVTTKPGAVAYLEKLKRRGVKMCIASATEPYMIERALKTTGIADFFEFILSTYDVGKTKTSPLLFDTCLAKFGASKETTAVFEDAYYSIETAKQNGYYVIAIEDSFEAEHADKIKQLADEYYSSFENIL